MFVTFLLFLIALFTVYVKIILWVYKQNKRKKIIKEQHRRR